MAVIYRPAHQRQLVPTDPFGKYNCTAYSAAIAIDRATIGGVLVTGKDVRAASSEPIPSPASPGLNLPQIVAVAAKWHVELTYRTGRFVDVLAALSRGQGVCLQGDYDQMGAYSCQGSFLGDHCVFVNNLNTPGTRALVYDPLCPDYRYMPIATLKRYAEKHAAANGGVVRFATTRITPNLPKQIN